VRAWLSLAALAVVVAGLALWVHNKPAPGRSDTYALSPLEPKTVTRIRIERTAPAGLDAARGVEAVVLKKHGAHWRMSAPVAARAEAFQVERLLAILGARSTVRYAASDRSRYGLDSPVAVLTLNDQTFAFGAINKTTAEQYVATGNDVFLVPLAIGAALPRTADALLARKLFAPNEAPVRFDLPGFTVALEEGTWAVAPPMADIGGDERNAWVDAWRQATAISVSRNAGNTTAQHEIKVQLKDGEPIVLRILLREPELALLRIDEGIEYRFVADVGRRMLAPPGAPRTAAVRGERVNK
jgi:hypothetical protein